MSSVILSAVSVSRPISLHLALRIIYPLMSQVEMSSPALQLSFPVRSSIQASIQLLLRAFNSQSCVQMGRCSKDSSIHHSHQCVYFQACYFSPRHHSELSFTPLPGSDITHSSCTLSLNHRKVKWRKVRSIFKPLWLVLRRDLALTHFICLCPVHALLKCAIDLTLL